MDISGHAELLAYACATAAEVSKHPTLAAHLLPGHTWDRATVLCGGSGPAQIRGAMRSALFAVYRRLALSHGPLHLERNPDCEPIFRELFPDGPSALDAVPLRSRGGRLTGALVTGRGEGEDVTATLSNLESI